MWEIDLSVIKYTKVEKLLTTNKVSDGHRAHDSHGHTQYHIEVLDLYTTLTRRFMHKETIYP